MASTLKLAKQVINRGDGILILANDLIQLSIVNAHSERTIILIYKQHWCIPWWNTRCDEPLYKRSFNWYFNSLSSGGVILLGGIEICWVSRRISIQKLISLSGGNSERSSRNIFGNSLTTGTESRVGALELESLTRTR